MAGVLHVQVKSAYEAECAELGGADRIVVVGADDHSPVPLTMEKIRKTTSVHARVMLKLRTDFVTDGGEMTRMKGLAFSYRDAGADGFVFGFLNDLSGIDRLACAELAGDDTWGWTFSRAIDAALDQDRAWEDLAGLPRLDSVMTAGSARQVHYGIDTLIQRRAITPPVIVAGELSPEDIPWLVRGGLRQFYVDQPPITVDAVRAWRRLIDDEVTRVG
ncbi:MAG: copper homeostasis protein CutC [Propionibacteriaceae bacterium]|nr:copper homeostasis protein CutC [Propionibacteriaceae bacterium]